MRSVLITGASGLVGRHLAKAIKAGDPDCRILTLGRGASRLSESSSHCAADLTETSSLGAIAGFLKEHQPTGVYHLAGVIHASAERVLALNVMGTSRLLEALRTSGVPAKFVSLGSAAEYGDQEDPSRPLREEAHCRPVGTYGISKHAATLLSIDYFRRFGVRAIICRPFNVLGPGISPSLLLGSVLEKATAALKSGAGSFAIGNVTAWRDFVGVSEMARALVCLMDKGVDGEIYNVGLGKATSVRWVVEEALAALPGRLTYSSNADPARGADPSTVHADISKINALLDQPLKDTLADEIRLAATRAIEQAGIFPQ